MDEIKIKNIFAAVFDKKVLDSIIPLLVYYKINVLGTEGTVKYLKAKGVKARSVVFGFDFDGRVKSLDRKNFIAILADKNNKKHMAELKRAKVSPVDAVIVDLYKPDKKNFPETMDIGGQTLIRAAVKNFENVVVCFNKKSIADFEWELKKNKGFVDLKFRRNLAVKALKFIAARCRLEANILKA